jgi:uncharacterized protein (TIGR02246 family)
MLLSPEESIREVVEECMHTWNKHDAKAFASLFAKDADFTNWMGQGATGRDAIEKYHEPLLATRFKTTRQATENIKVRLIKPDVASVDIWWNMTGALDDTGQPPTPETRHPELDHDQRGREMDDQSHAQSEPESDSLANRPRDITRYDRRSYVAP